MNYFAPRTCIEIPEIGSHDDRHLSTPLEKFRGDSCYVLLAPPGAGKTKTFEKEAEQEKGLYITARKFINSPDQPEWNGKTLFIDGLDERRAQGSDSLTPFDQIWAKLQNLGCPRFRLSCREADWFGSNDRNHLKDVSPDGKLKVLRLDPLSREDILKILRCNHGVNNAELFVASAEEKGIGILLVNPQSLKMLASAVTDKKWPETRMQTFGLACRKLLEEHNQDHELADLDGSNIYELLNAAGRLCAIQLLAGCAGYVLTNEGKDYEYISLKQIPSKDRKIFRYVLRSKLFESQDGTHITPVHRQVAEFLGGQYLAKLTQERLSVRRILALMTGYDGGIISELRGLSAWLAAYSPQSRREIIERDPLGTILYGDVRRFSIDEKRQILRRISEEVKKDPSFKRMVIYDPHLEDLATPDMQKDFQETLTDPARDDVQQSFVMFLLETLQHGLSIPELADVLIKTTRDNSWKHEVRCLALYAYVQQQKDNKQKIKEVTTLLEDVNSGLVSDPNDELLGTILKELYPCSLSTSDVWKYLREPKAPNLINGSYASFWITRIAEQSTTSQLAELLDGLYENFDDFFAGYEAREKKFSFFSLVFPALLTRLLKTTGNEVSPDRLSNWLWIVSDSEITYSSKNKTEISAWLNNHPEIQKTLFEKWSEHNDINPYEIDRRLFGDRGLGCTHPQDFGLWCLKHAVTATDERFKKFFLRTAADAIENNIFNKGLSQEIIEETFADDPDLKQQLLESQSTYRNISKQQENFAERQKAREREELRERINYVKSHEKALRENRCPPHLIHNLAVVYFGEDVNLPSCGHEDRLHNFLGDDKNLVSIILKAFRESVIRSDVPDEAEIIRLRENNETHYLALPFLAGMEELSRNDPESDEIPIAEKQMRQALAFYFNAPLPISFRGSHPAWYRELLRENPNMVSDVLISSARPRTLNTRETISDLYELVFQDNQAEVSKLMTLPLLKTFPVRCAKQQLQDLNYLLRSALLHCERKPFLDLINTKLSYTSMNIAQRVYWLTAGLIVSPSSFTEKLEAYLTGRERRVKSLLEFVKELPDELIKHLDVPALEFLIRTIGYLSPWSSNLYKSGWVSSTTEAVDLVHRLIQQLASIQLPSATNALEKLLSDDGLHSWRQHLMDSLRRQKITRREAAFSHPDVNQVLQTLSNKKPSNAADLSALTTQVLTDLAENIRDGNTSDWRQYWDMDTKNEPSKPRIEDLCRDALLSDLRIKLNPLGIDAQPEGRYADDKRSDIRISYDAMCNVPVEIKKSSHRDLWSAIKAQLIAKYTRDPETDGYGIYLVFWFGKESCQLSGSGTRPQSAMELKERLIDSLTTDEQRKISICVIDVAKPRKKRT